MTMTSSQASSAQAVMTVLASLVLLSATAAVAAVDCICPASYNPVCAENGVTYSNPCTARCAGVWVAHSGRCNSTMMSRRVRESDASSSSDLQDDLTEGVVQMRQLQQITLDGTNSSCACSADYDPVCTVKGVTRSNACTAACYYREDVAYYGECSPNGPPKTTSQAVTSSADPLTGHGMCVLALATVVGMFLLVSGPFL